LNIIPFGTGDAGFGPLVILVALGGTEDMGVDTGVLISVIIPVAFARWRRLRSRRTASSGADVPSGKMTFVPEPFR